MKKVIFIALGLFISASAGYAEKAITPSPVPHSYDDAAPLIRESCTKCHALGKICNNLGKNDRAYWDKTVMRMISKGASLQPKDKDLVVDYLFSLQEGHNPICP